MTTKKIVLIIGGVVVALGLVVILFVVGIAGLALYSVGNSEAAMQAKAFLLSSEKLKADIGEVKNFGCIVTGSINIRNGNGEATLNLKVIRQKTVNATVHLVMVNGGAWRVSSASYINTSGQTVKLLDPYEARIQVWRLIA